MLSPWKKDFPALYQRPIHYLDSAATCQVPTSVINAVSQYLQDGQGNAGRSLHGFGEQADDLLSICRIKVAAFIRCQEQQLIFTKSATESINLVAVSLGHQLTPDDSILITEIEHHSNFLPWQRLCQQTGARLNILPLNQQGEFKTEYLAEYLADNCKLFALSHCSNVLGNRITVEKMISQASQANVKTLLDGAQAVAHQQTDVTVLGCDYYAFSGHKLYSTGGSGVLYCKDPSSLEPLLLGGGIATRTSVKQHQLRTDIGRFEAATSCRLLPSRVQSAIFQL
jgi:selenocysteine lyase/cysteine desulfurase